MMWIIAPILKRNRTHICSKQTENETKIENLRKIRQQQKKENKNPEQKTI